ncbi:TIGR02569 family protein [Rhizocola hellebori]|uniref:TIGR02569 family protein n=1 Tax=Rhizocola hellebori TaxID=1392758 RepID=A0A8J3VDB7_9ACTN|nr:TIGR02569 family protein [Rhizocola hellebori]GIH02321.1 TIGR02569 family protein [Rhizocola hellebori]
MTVSATPPPQVLAAFGAYREAVPLPGGQGQTWLSGEVVLKPAGLEAETIWVAEVLSALVATARFRVARPVRASDGSWVVQGWQAWQRTPGAPDPRRWDEILVAGEAFHEALAGMARPSFLDERDDPWTYGERLAWEELPLRGGEAMAELLQPLASARREVQLASQPVHGDLLGNVMFADRLAPTVIDWPVYYRPVSWALAVAVVDALTWHAAPATLVDRLSDRPQWDQMLVRALMYRIATSEGRRRVGLPVREHAGVYRPVVDLILA